MSFDQEHDEGMGVEASVGADATWRLRFQMPPTLPTGTAKLLVEVLANATSGVAVFNPKWASVASIKSTVNLTTSNQWTVSASGTAEYYLETSGGGDPSVTHPIAVDDDGAEMLGDGTLGSLAVGEWAWGDNDTLGFSTVYVRLADGADPDTSTAMTAFNVGEEPSAASLNAEGSTYLTWFSDVADFYLSVTITLDADTLVASEEVVMDLVFETTNWTLAQVSTWIVSIIWE